MLEKLTSYIASVLSDIRSVRNEKKPSVFQIVRFWSVFSLKEKMIFCVFSLFAVSAGSIFGVLFAKDHIIEVPKVGGTYTEGVLEEPRFINPILATNDIEQSIGSLVFQGLFQYGSDGVLRPNAAEAYSISPDGKRYTITLKKDNRWHDGMPVTADDVLFTIAMIQNPEYRSPLRPNWQGVVAEKIDDATIAITLRQPYGPFAQNLTVGILPKHIWSAIRPEISAQAEFNTKPIGSGPYVFKKFARSTAGSILSYTLERRDDIEPKASPYIQTIVFQIFTSEETLLSAYQRNKIDGMSFVSMENSRKLPTRTSTVYSVKLPQVFALFLNQTKNKILADASVREAIDYAVDRRDIINAVFHGGAAPIAIPIPPGSLGYDETVVVPERDVQKANRLLEKAGWRMNAESGIREKTTKKTKTTPESTELFHVTLVTSLWPDLIETAQRIKSQLHDVGIEVAIETASTPELEYQYIRPRNYDILLFGESFGKDPDPFAFWHSSQIRHPGLNLSLYANKKVDALLESSRRAQNQADAAEKYKEMQRLIIKDRPAIFLYTPNYFFVMQNEVRGVVVNNLAKPSERFYTTPQWYMKTGWKLK